MPWNYVCVQGRFYIAKNFVIDALSARHCQDGVAEPRHVVEKLSTGVSGKRIQVGRQGRYQCFTFTGCHFRYLAFVQGYTTYQLHIVVQHVPGNGDACSIP